MVLAEVPLWVSHGNVSTGADTKATLPGMGFASGKPSNASTNGTANANSAAASAANTNTSSTTQQQQQLTLDQNSAKSALSLLAKKRHNNKEKEISVPFISTGRINGCSTFGKPANSVRADAASQVR